VPKKHLFDDLAHVYVYQCSVPDILLRKFVPRVSLLPIKGDFQQRYAETLLLHRFDSWSGFNPLMTEAFVSNPYRAGNAYIPTIDLPKRGMWSNCLWFLVDILKPTHRKYYRRPLQRQLRGLFCGGIDSWNDIWQSLGPALDDLENAENFIPKQWHEEHWPDQISGQFEHALFVEDHIFSDNTSPHESLFARWNSLEKDRQFNYFRKQQL